MVKATDFDSVIIGSNPVSLAKNNERRVFMDALTILMAYILVFVPLSIIAAIIYKILEWQRRKREKAAKAIREERKYKRDVEMAQIGIRLMNEPKKKDEPKPVRKVYGDFAHMADVWK